MSLRPPAVSGLFYPASPEALRDTIHSLFLPLSVSEQDSASCHAIVSPHAGYMYSGGIAAQAFLSLKQRPKPKRLFLLGPSHTLSYSGISLFDGDGYRMPLGDVRIDRDMVSQLYGSHHDIRFIEAAHQKEHSIEVLLPFLYMIYDGDVPPIVPLVFGQNSFSFIQEVVSLLDRVSDPDTDAFVVSTDMSHFFSQTIAKQMDDEAIRLVEEGDWEALFRRSKAREVEFCGIEAMTVVGLLMAKWGLSDWTTLQYGHSGEVSGDLDSVVRYVGMVC